MHPVVLGLSALVFALSIETVFTIFRFYITGTE